MNWNTEQDPKHNKYTAGKAVSTACILDVWAVHGQIRAVHGQREKGTQHVHNLRSVLKNTTFSK